MKLVILTALIAVCGAAKLDRTYLPPPSAKTAGGNPEELQAPRNSLNNGLGGLPKGSYENEFQGVVVDAAAAGVRASEPEDSGLGAPRISYGSTDSKVGAAAFKISPPRPQANQHTPAEPANSNQQSVFASQKLEAFNADQSRDIQKPQSHDFNDQHFQNTQEFANEPARASLDRKAGILKFENVVGPDHYYYAFQTDNDIKAEENGDATNGVRAQGGFSYKGDDGQTYSITYVADEKGYQPKGAHLPTPPPIPDAILRSLEKNAKDEADGLVDDGSYNAEKYNVGSEYSENVNANGKYQFSKFGGEADAYSSDTLIDENQQKTTDDQKDFNKQGSNRFSQQSSDLTKSAVNGQSKISFNRQESSNTHNEQPQQFSNIGSPHDDSSSIEFGQPSKGIQSQGNKFSSFSSASVHSSGHEQANNYLPPHKSTSRPQYGIRQNRPQKGRIQSDKPQATVDADNLDDDSYKYEEEPSNLVPLGEQDLQSESRPEQAITSFGQPVSNTNKFQSEIELRPSNIQNKPSDSIHLSNGRIPSINFQEQASPSANVNNANGYLPPNQRNQNSRPFKQSQSFIQFNQQHSGNTDFENTKHSPNPPAFSGSPVFEAKPQQTNGFPRPQYQNPSQNDNKYQSKFQTNLNGASSFPFGLQPQKSTIQPNTELTTPFESMTSDYDASIGRLAMSSNSAYNQPSQHISSPQYNNAENKFVAQSRLESPKPFGQVKAPSFTSQISSMPYKQNPQIGNRSQPQGFSPSPDTQYSASTSRPHYTQQQQGPNDSYIYNHPAKPFSTPQGSRFPSAPSSQFNRIRQQSAFSQSNSSSLPQGSNRYPKPPMLLQFAPTAQSKNQFGGQLSDRGTKTPVPPTLTPSPSQHQTNVNGVTQASISRFPPPTPTQSSQYNAQRTTQFQPQAQAFQQQKEQTDKRIEPAVSSQQYTGEIYEYKKPAQTLPPPDSTPVSSTVAQAQGQFSSPQLQFGQRKDQKIQRPTAEFGGPMFIAEPSYKQHFNKNTDTHNTQSKINVVAQPQQNEDVIKPFGALAQSMLRPEDTHPQPFSQTGPQSAPSRTRYSQIENKEPKDTKKPLSENYESKEESSNDNAISSVPPKYVPEFKPSCCRNNALVHLPGHSREQIESEKRLLQNSQPMAPFLFPSKLGLMDFSGGQNKPSSFVAQPEVFSGPRQPPSFDEETGYHY